MTGHIILFAGPSLPFAPPAPIELRPPARCGDMLRAHRDGAKVVGLVDGLFEVAPTVWHKEILHLIDAGVRVYGAASLGALRAAELDRFGMIGVGTIYADYRDGRIERDDAVMLCHAPAAFGHGAVTLALVDAEASIAVSGLPARDQARLLAIAGRCHFSERDWAGILAAYAVVAGPEAALRADAAIAAHAFSRKMRDTEALIAEMLRPAAVANPAQPRATVPQTSFFRRLIDEVAREGG